MLILKECTLPQLRYLSHAGPWPFVATEGDVHWPNHSDVQLFDELWARRHSHHARALLRKLSAEVRKHEENGLRVAGSEV